MALVLDGSRRVDTLVQTPSNERNGIVSPGEAMTSPPTN